MKMKTVRALTLISVLVASLTADGLVLGHDHSAHRSDRARSVALAKAAASAEVPASADQEGATCQLTIDLIDATTQNSLAGLVRITDLESGKFVQLPSEIHRDLNWYALSPQTTVRLPRTKLKIEAFHGIETGMRVHEQDLTGTARGTARLVLDRIYDAREKKLYNGNTHLHLMRMTYAEAIRYLRLVPRADGLDLVFLSHLRRLPDERTYISNQVVENDLAGGGGELGRLSQHGVLFANGEEHRHNFGPGGEGYGHVMLLDLLKLIRPVSIGPGIMSGQGTDGIPLQHGIKTARADGATVIWCHNDWGYEDVPNWTAGLLHAQNIFDGSAETTYEDSFYKYLNLGMKVPFSTGTDWFIYDFSRVYVPLEGELTGKTWLAQLQAGRSYITNGTFLEFSVNDRAIGDTIAMSRSGALQVSGRAIGRNNFRNIELIHNGDVIRTAECHPIGGHFSAQMDLVINVDQPGWLALRTPLRAGTNEFDKDLFAHTSPIYVEVAGKRIFRREVAEQLIAEMEENIDVIRDQGEFADPDEIDKVLNVHREGIKALRQRLSE
jgi:hypothetical protein